MSRRTLLALAATVTALVAVMLGLRVWDDLRRSNRLLGVGFAEGSAPPRLAFVSDGQAAARAGLQVDDVLTAIDGRPIRDEADYDRCAEAFAHGRPVRFDVLREGQALSLLVRPGQPFPLTEQVFNALAALGYLALGLLALLQGSEDRRGTLLFGFGGLVAVELATPTSLYGFGEWGSTVGVLMPLVVGLQTGLELHLTSLIPRAAPWYASRPWLTRLFYAAGLGVGVATAASALAVTVGGLEGGPVVALRAFLDDWSLFAWAVAIVAILNAQLRSCQRPRERHQVLLVLLACGPWALYVLVLAAAELGGWSLPGWVGSQVQPIALLVYPIAIFVAIFRYHLFDIELVVKRGVVYSTVTVALVLLLWAAISLGGVLFEGRVEAGQFPYPVWAASAVMLVVGLLFVPIRNAAKRWVDRRLFPERLAMRQSLADLAAELPAQGDLAKIGRHLVRRVGEIFGFSSVTLLVADPQTGLLMTQASSVVDLERVYGQSFLLEGSDPGVAMLHRTRRVLRADQVTPHSAALAQRLDAFKAYLAIGLASGDTLTGVLLLGTKSGDERLAAEELELLSLLSPMVGTVMQNVRLFASATYEGLTGLLRREAILGNLDRELQRALRYGRPLTVGMADIDRFKRVNDSLGHLAGDAVLKRVAQVLEGALRSSDAVGRYGGEEFLLVLPETDLHHAVRVAEKLRHAVEQLESPLAEAADLRMILAIGLAELDTAAHGTTVDDLIAAADANLLQAKRDGRNRVVPSA